MYSGNGTLNMGTNIFTCTGKGKMEDIQKKDSKNYSGGWYIFEYEDFKNEYEILVTF